MNDDFLTVKFSLLSNKISKLAKYKSKADEIFTEHHHKIKDTHAQLPDWSIIKESGQPYHFYYQSPSTGEDITASAAPLKLEDQLELNTLQKLKMYHWLLAEAYEEFEKFVVEAHAYCGVKQLSLWIKPLNWSDNNSGDITYYKKKFKYKDESGVPYRQLNAFRAGSKHFAKYETDGPTRTNYRVLLAVIEQFRHRIVHNGGYCQDLKLFMDDVQGKLPGINRKTVTPYVESYFFLHGEGHLIDLLEYEAFDEDGTPNGCYHDTVPHFLTVLVEYAQLIIESIQVHLTADKE